MAAYYPPVGFHFRVSVPDLSPRADDARFTEVTGLSMELGTEEMPEGGENRFVQRYPTRAKYPDLVLKRGFLLRSDLFEWIRACVEDFDVRPRNIDVHLLNPEHNPLLTWHVRMAVPMKWAVTDLNASSNSVVIESLQFTYQYFALERS